jgi:E3 ubiquitin-protein ligase RNF14
MQGEEYNIPAVSDALPPDEELFIGLEQEALWQEGAEANPQINEDHALALEMQADLQLEEMAPATRDCAVCGETTPIPELPALMACIHPLQTCAECFGGMDRFGVGE